MGTVAGIVLNAMLWIYPCPSIAVVNLPPGMSQTVPFNAFLETYCGPGATETSGATVAVDDPAIASAKIVSGSGVVITTTSTTGAVGSATRPTNGYTVVRYTTSAGELGQVNVTTTP